MMGGFWRRRMLFSPVVVGWVGERGGGGYGIEGALDLDIYIYIYMFIYVWFLRI